MSPGVAGPQRNSEVMLSPQNTREAVVEKTGIARNSDQKEPGA